MKEIKIFVEGDSDKKFIQDYIQYLKIDCSIINLTVEKTNGKEDDKITKSLEQFIDKKADGSNVIILDANDDDISKRKKEIATLLEKKNLESKIFFLPDDKRNGYLETLLLESVSEKSEIYFSCFDDFNKCIENMGGSHNAPSIKDMAYIYSCSLLTKSESKQRAPIISPAKMDYSNNRFWNLEHDVFNNLKEFLITNIK